MTGMTEEQFANLSDDEILNMATPPEITGGAQPQNTDDDPDDDAGKAAQETADGGGQDSVPGSQEETTVAADIAKGDEAGKGDEDKEDKSVLASDDDNVEDKTKPAAKGGDVKDGEQGTEDKSKAAKPEEKPADKPAEAQTPIDYEASYKKLMAPFKANGKMIELKSPEEAIQLMQMGAHYTKKMQALQPNLKLLRMLENNNLLDENQISYLIDLSKKDPAAIKKLVKESGIDPIDIDTNTDPGYKPGNHQVSDADFRFQTTLEEVSSDPAGKALIQTIHKTWDNESKEALWQDPNILRVLAGHRENGIYDKITEEIERRRMLGQTQNEPFIQVYYAVGQELTKQGAFNPKPAADGSAQKPAETPQNRVLETRPAQPKTVTNSEKARAASPTKAAPPKVAQEFNPLSMSDEDFEKNAQLAQRM